MILLLLPLLLTLPLPTLSQHPPTYEPEHHPPLPITTCTPTTCTPLSTSLVLDAEWRWLHALNSTTNCYDWGSWNRTLCPDGKTCGSNCALEGATYDRVYGVGTKAGNLTMGYVTRVEFSQNVGGRVFVVDEGEGQGQGQGQGDRYVMWRVANREVAFEVDVSQVPCGVKASVYLVGMEADGGLGGANRAGARYGTGYCSAGCGRDMRFVGGEANVDDWVPNPHPEMYVGKGRYGSCCPEVALWNANSRAASLSAHPCRVDRQTRCEGLDCEDWLCDGVGCDVNSYRLGDREFYGPGGKLDTTRKFTVITQFVTDTETDTGTLVEIRRKYIQDGVVLGDSKSSVPAVQKTSSISDSYCRKQKDAFGERDVFAEKGGMAQIGKVLAQGMVLVFAIDEDQEGHMLWLDSNWPVDADPNAPGVARGACANDTGDPATVPWEASRAKVSYADIRVGWIGMSEAAVKGSS